MSVKLFNKDNSYFYLTEFGYNYLIKHRNEPPRIRNDYLLHIVIKDTLHFSAFDVPEGKALLICKGQKHHFNVSPGYEHYWFGFDGTNVEDFFKNYGISLNKHQIIEFHNFDYIERLLYLAYSNSENRKSGIAFSALVAICSLIKTKKEKPHKAVPELVKEFIEQNYHRRLTIQEIANYFFVSEKHLCRIFSNAYHCSPQEYLRNTRMKKAKYLLEENILNIKEIAFSVGYPDQLQFSAMFKKHYGISPSKYRKSNPNSL